MTETESRTFLSLMIKNLDDKINLIKSNKLFYEAMLNAEQYEANIPYKKVLEQLIESYNYSLYVSAILLETYIKIENKEIK